MSFFIFKLPNNNIKPPIPSIQALNILQIAHVKGIRFSSGALPLIKGTAGAVFPE